MAVVIYTDKAFRGSLMETISHDKGLEIQAALNNVDSLSEAQKAYIKHVKSVYVPDNSIPASWKQAVEGELMPKSDVMIEAERYR